MRSVGDEDPAIVVDALLSEVLELFEELRDVYNGSIADEVGGVRSKQAAARRSARYCGNHAQR